MPRLVKRSASRISFGPDVPPDNDHNGLQMKPLAQSSIKRSNARLRRRNSRRAASGPPEMVHGRGSLFNAPLWTCNNPWCDQIHDHNNPGAMKSDGRLGNSGYSAISYNAEQQELIAPCVKSSREQSNPRFKKVQSVAGCSTDIQGEARAKGQSPKDVAGRSAAWIRQIIQKRNKKDNLSSEKQHRAAIEASVDDSINAETSSMVSSEGGAILETNNRATRSDSSPFRRDTVHGEMDPFWDAAESQESWASGPGPNGRQGVSEAPSTSIYGTPASCTGLEVESLSEESQGRFVGGVDWDALTNEELAAVLRTLCKVQNPVEGCLESTLDLEPTSTGKGKGRAMDQIHSRQHSIARKSVPRTAEAADALRRKESDLDTSCENVPEGDKGYLKDDIATPETSRLRDCIVCGDAKDPLEFPAKAPTSKCHHPPQACSECLHSWMASQFETKGTEGIVCPECPEALEYNDVQRAASAETFEAYDKLSTRNALSSLPDFAWCLSPKCGSGQLNLESQDYMDCASCGYKQCLKHKIAWHWGETCKQYDYRTSGRKERDQQEKLSEATLDKVSKKCPGPGCGWRIQKIDGCDHMTCKKCRFEFCWQCLASQKEIKRVGNTAHQAWCKFHSNNLNVAWPFNVH